MTDATTLETDAPAKPARTSRMARIAKKQGDYRAWRKATAADPDAITVTTRTEIHVVKNVRLGPGCSRRMRDTGAAHVQLKLTAKSTPAVKSHWHAAVTLTGPGTLDLLALTDREGRPIATAGLRVQAIQIENPAAEPLTVAPAASGGYDLALKVAPQGIAQHTSNGGMPVIGPDCHALEIDGSGASNWMIIFG